MRLAVLITRLSHSIPPEVAVRWFQGQRAAQNRSKVKRGLQPSPLPSLDAQVRMGRQHIIVHILNDLRVRRKVTCTVVDGGKVYRLYEEKDDTGGDAASSPVSTIGARFQ